jgi:hypothetical protein
LIVNGLNLNDQLYTYGQSIVLNDYLTEDPWELLLQYREKESIAFDEIFHNRDDIYIEILRNYFTSLGSPEKIIFID